MISSKKNSDQIYIWVIVAILIVVVIGVLIWFLTRKKENYIKIEENEFEIENFEDTEQDMKNLEEAENYFMNGYAVEYVENFELLNMTNSHSHPLNDHFNKILHIANVVSRSPNLEEVKKEADRIGLDNDFSQRVLKDQESAHKFSTELHINLAKYNKNLGTVVQKTAPEIFEKVRTEVKLPKVEKFTLECYEKNGLSHLIEKQDRIIRKLKNALKTCLLKRVTRKNLFHHPEVRKYARHAHIQPTILLKIIENKDDLERFMNDEKTLEYYDPDSFIENYWGLANKIKGGFEKAGSAIKNTAIKAGNAIKDTAVMVGGKIKDAAMTVGDWVKQTANQIKDGVVNAYEKVKGFAENSFNAIKNGVVNGINTAIQGLKDVVNAIGEAAERAWAAIKKAFSEAGNWIVDFAKNTFKSIMDQFLRICKQDTDPKCDTLTYQINTTRLKKMLLDKFQTILYSTFLTPVAWVFELPFIGGKIKGEISKLIMPAFNPVWDLLQPTVSQIVTNIMHSAFPATQGFKISFTEWFSMIDNIYEKFQNEVEKGEFENNFREHIRKTIKQTKKMENLDKDKDKKNNFNNKSEKLEKVYQILQDKVKPELHIHLKEIVQHILEISDSR